MTQPPREHILVIGATSDIARAICHALATEQTAFLLVGRNTEELEHCAADLRIRHSCAADTARFDAQDVASHGPAAEAWCTAAGGAPDGVLVCHGYTPPAEASMTDPEEARRVLDVNFTSVVTVLTPIAERMAERGRGWIAGVGSVAGDRGRQSNYVYGSAKAGVATYLQGLRNRLASRGVHVLTIKPGFVDTRMLRSQMQGSSPLIASTATVARDVRRAIRRRRNVLYTPWYWRFIMFIIRAIPEPIFKRLRL